MTDLDIIGVNSLTHGDQRRITIISGRACRGKSKLAALLRSRVPHAQKPSYPTDSALINMLMEEPCRFYIEFVDSEHIVLSHHHKEDPIIKLREIYGDATFKAVASQIDAIYKFVGARQYIYFASHHDYWRYLKDPIGYGPVPIQYSPDNPFKADGWDLY